AWWRGGGAALGGYLDPALRAGGRGHRLGDGAAGTDRMGPPGRAGPVSRAARAGPDEGRLPVHGVARAAYPPHYLPWPPGRTGGAGGRGRSAGGQGDARGRV